MDLVVDLVVGVGWICFGVFPPIAGEVRKIHHPAPKKIHRPQKPSHKTWIHHTLKKSTHPQHMANIDSP